MSIPDPPAPVMTENSGSFPVAGPPNPPPATPSPAPTADAVNTAETGNQPDRPPGFSKPPLTINPFNPTASVPPPFWVKKEKDGPSCILCETPLSRITAWYVDRHAVSGRHVTKLREAQAEGKYLDVDLTPMQVQLRIAAAAAGQNWGPGGLVGGSGAQNGTGEDGGDDEGYDTLLGPPQQYAEGRWKALTGGDPQSLGLSSLGGTGRGGGGGRDMARSRGGANQESGQPRFDENGLPMRSSWDTVPAHRRALATSTQGQPAITGIDAMVPSYEDLLRAQQHQSWPTDPGSLAIFFPPQFVLPQQPVGYSQGMGGWGQTASQISDGGLVRR
ncbi:hypothetical protein HDU93_008603 [Gonapodya sp. JEL0774]|nr:hypothetical protein HDU93_008603 [Gonapodya sp. JEL0774]